MFKPNRKDYFDSLQYLHYWKSLQCRSLNSGERDVFAYDVADFHTIIMNSVQLRKEAPKRETSKCIFCCKSGPRGNDKKLSSTPDGQSNVITSFRKVKRQPFT